MTNPYKTFLNDFFSTLLDYRHSTNRLNKVLKKDVEIYTKEGARLHLASALVISDWSGPTDNGWEINFHTGISTETPKDTYEIEINKMLSRELCLMYAQSFEALEKFLKDCFFSRANRDKKLKDYIISLIPKISESELKRYKMPGGDNLFKVLKKAGGKTFTKYSSENNLNIRFSELWSVLSESRHAITHSRSYIKQPKINLSKHHSDIFNFLFNSSKIDNELLLIELDYSKFDRLVKRLSEFAFQVFKILSTEEEIEWDIYK